jgi:hypothetical protein
MPGRARLQRGLEAAQGGHVLVVDALEALGDRADRLAALAAAAMILSSTSVMLRA